MHHELKSYVVHMHNHKFYTASQTRLRLIFYKAIGKPYILIYFVFMVVEEGDLNPNQCFGKITWGQSYKLAQQAEVWLQPSNLLFTSWKYNQFPSANNRSRNTSKQKAGFTSVVEHAQGPRFNPHTATKYLIFKKCKAN